MALSIEQIRYLAYRAAWLCDRSAKDSYAAAIACLSATSTALTCTHEAIQLFGGYGFTAEYDVERYCRDARMLKSLCCNINHVKDAIADDVVGNIR
jgi:alkylation response protein AidB-like acyl-CoA dehydrogenase